MNKITKILIGGFLLVTPLFASVNEALYNKGEQIYINNITKKIHFQGNEFLSMIEADGEDEGTVQKMLNDEQNIINTIKEKIKENDEAINDEFTDDDERVYLKAQNKKFKKLLEYVKEIYSDPEKKKAFVYFLTKLSQGFVPKSCK